jgi:acyl-CoA reductase-like NAD-dependent aldehyde dehydrogenase
MSTSDTAVPRATGPIPRRLPAGWPTGRADAARSADVVDPYTRQAIACVGLASPSHVAEAVAAAGSHLPARPAGERAEVLERAATLLRERREDFAGVIAMEAGKPLAQARVEASRCVDTFVYSAIEARTWAGELVPMEGTAAGAGRLAMVVREPVGVIGAIAPFNFPLNLVAHKVAPAIAAGCPIVLKPAPQTPLSALGLAGLLAEAGLPDGALAVLPGDADVGAAIVEHPDVPLVSFTGSAPVGRAIERQVPHKRVLLELGNATPVIVAADADIGDAARRVARSGYTHAGQSCVSVQRVYVERPAYDAFLTTLTAEVGALATGDPLDERTDVGPVIDARSRQRVREWIGEAVAAGGSIATGGDVRDELIQPCVIADLPPNCRIAREEVFGPVVGVAPIHDIEEGVALANASDLGLQAGIFTGRVDMAMALVPRLRFGGVLINETPTFRADQMPYGGVKDSGNTREGPRAAVQEMTVPKLVIVRMPG